MPYLITSNSRIEEITVLKRSGGFSTVRFEEGISKGGAIRIRDSRVFDTREEAEKALEKSRPKPKEKIKRVPEGAAWKMPNRW